MAAPVGLVAGRAAADLDAPTGYPWPEPRPLAQAAAWANQEPMKNVAEIGQLRDLYRVLNPVPGR